MQGGEQSTCGKTLHPHPQRHPTSDLLCHPPKAAHSSRVLVQVSPADPALSQHPPALLLGWGTPGAVLRGSWSSLGRSGESYKSRDKWGTLSSSISKWGSATKGEPTGTDKWVSISLHQWKRQSHLLLWRTLSAAKTHFTSFTSLHSENTIWSVVKSSLCFCFMLKH